MKPAPDVTTQTIKAQIEALQYIAAYLALEIDRQQNAAAAGAPSANAFTQILAHTGARDVLIQTQAGMEQILAQALGDLQKITAAAMLESAKAAAITKDPADYHKASGASNKAAHALAVIIDQITETKIPAAIAG